MPLTPAAARSHLARFLFRGDDVFKEVSALSGGERSRLELALLFLLPANLLLLDEPTNHLDIPAREALEAFMAGTAATVLVVSHDRRLLEKVCESLWVVDDGLAVPFEGGYRAWRAAVVGRLDGESCRRKGGWTASRRSGAGDRRARAGERGSGFESRAPVAILAPAASSPGRGPGVGGRNGREDARAGVPAAIAASGRPAVKVSKDAYRRRKAQIDEELARLNERKLRLESALLDPGVHGNFVELRRVSGDLAAVNEALAAAEEAWLELEEAAP